MKLSIVIPVYNERKTIEEVIRRVKASLIRQNLSAEIVVVNDGSTDGSSEVIRTIPDIVFVDQKKNRGKGASVKAGFEASTGDILLIQDADLEYDPDDYSAIIRPILNGESEVSMGSRFLKFRPVFLGENKSPYLTHYIGNRLVVWLTNFLYRHNATDYEACYKAFSHRIVDSITTVSTGFEYDNELICKILKSGGKIIEVPIKYYPRSYESGKKITWKHGFKMLWTIVKVRFCN